MAIRMRRGGEGHLRCRERSELFDTAEPDSVSFSEGPVNGSRFGDTHFGSPHEGRRVRWIGIAVADKAPRICTFVDDSSKYPAIGCGIRKPFLQGCPNSGAFS